MRIRVVALALLLCGSTICARAEDSPNPEALAAAEELIAVISPDMMRQLMNGTIETMWPILEEKVLAGKKIDDATVAKLRNEFTRIQIAGVEETMKEWPPIYARHFTVDELHQLTAFYRTPIGTKTLREMPQMTKEGNARSAQHLRNQLQQEIDAFTKILQENGYAK
jgi:uncharacterized protein